MKNLKMVSVVIGLAMCAVVFNLHAAELTAEKPVWQIGDSWTFKVSQGKKVHFYKMIVVDDKAVFEGEPCYKLEYAGYRNRPQEDEKPEYREWAFFSKDKDAILYLGSQKPDGEIKKASSSPIIIHFPLKDGLRWSHVDQSGLKAIYSASLEDIEVPCGKFAAFRIKGEFSTKNHVEFWHAPDCKFVYVKLILHNKREGWVKITELIDYQIR